MSEDLISRQAAIDIIQSYKKNTERLKEISVEDVVDMFKDLIDDIRNEPSAQPERKKGRWIWWYEESFTEHATEYTPHCKCSECGRECAPSVATSSNFCRNCGADMRGESDE